MSESGAKDTSIKVGQKKRVLIGCTGSVASIKVPLLVEQLLKTGKVEVAVVATENALHFFNPALPQEARLYRDTDEWQTWSKIEDPVLHIELRRWADILVIAPLDANTMAKMAGGICDNLLTCIVRAWDLQRPLLFCPAMNTHMWEHPLTAKHIETLQSFGYQEVKCVEKLLACGDKGYGAMAEVPTIVQAVMKALELTVPSESHQSIDEPCTYHIVTSESHQSIDEPSESHQSIDEPRSESHQSIDEPSESHQSIDEPRSESHQSIDEPSTSSTYHIVTYHE